MAIDEVNFPDEGFRTFVSDKFDSDDAVYLLRHTLFPEQYPITES